jgi:hypothetical protein
VEHKESVVPFSFGFSNYADTEIEQANMKLDAPDKQHQLYETDTSTNTGAIMSTMATDEPDHNYDDDDDSMTTSIPTPTLMPSV